MASVRLALVVAVAAVACQDLGSPAEAPDAADPGLGAMGPQLASCNPIANTGCGTGEKCTFNPESRLTWCYPAGIQFEGRTCTFDAASGSDDCRGTLYCWEGVCTEICDIRENFPCDDGENCRAVSAFSDWGLLLGVCLSTVPYATPWW